MSNARRIRNQNQNQRIMEAIATPETAFAATTTEDPEHDVEIDADSPLHNVENEFKDSVAGFMGIVTRIEKRRKELEEKEQQWKELEKRMGEHAAKAKDKIVIDVGGKKFSTTKDTLMSQEGTFFYAIIANGTWQPGEDGTYFIDRNPKHVQIILDFLRMRTVNCSMFNDWELVQLEEDLDFYQIKGFPLVIKDHIEGATLLPRNITNAHLPDKKFVLIYKGTRDGFTEAAFAHACHNKGPTLCCVATTSGYAFGGYNPESWKPSPTANPAAFLFCANTPYTTGAKFALKPGAQSATHTSGCLMVFGDDDIVVRTANQSDNTLVARPAKQFGGVQVTFAFPRSFTDTVGYGANSFAGTPSAPIREIEVFLVK